jgi:hypothetical protein
MAVSITLTDDDARNWLRSQNRGNPTAGSSAPANQTANAGGGSASAEADPWSDDAPSNNNAAAASSAQPTRNCAHGAMRYFPNGTYGPFFACSLGRDDPNKCKIQKA